MANNENLIPAKKGEVRNPKGKPKGLQNARTRYLRLLTLTEKIKNPVTGKIEDFSIIEQLDMQIIAKARKGDIRAYIEIMDRLEGKAQQKVDMTLEGDMNVALVEFVKPKEPKAPKVPKAQKQPIEPVKTGHKIVIRKRQSDARNNKNTGPDTRRVSRTI